MLVGEQYARPHRNAQRCPYRVPDWGMGPDAISLCPRYYPSPKRAILLVTELSQSGNILDAAGPRSRGAMADPKQEFQERPMQRYPGGMKLPVRQRVDVSCYRSPINILLQTHKCPCMCNLKKICCESPRMRAVPLSAAQRQSRTPSVTCPTPSSHVKMICRKPDGPITIRKSKLKDDRGDDQEVGSRDAQTL